MSSPILAQKALAIPLDIRESYLLNIPEVELHHYICGLLQNMESDAQCEITHGRDEFGRDIVLRRSSPFGHEYIAIVVKRGDSRGKISGRSSGPVDEVISQAKQSVSHPCHLKEIDFSRVPIGGAWVMFFGRLTDNAVKRIEAEAPTLQFKPFTIGWLADAFARHFPEVFFAGAASTYLQDKVVEFETIHDLSRRPKNLSDWYVDPTVAITQIDASTFSERLRKALKLQRISYQEFRDGLRSSDRYVLSAAPGLGKSTLLRKIALDSYKDALNETASLGLNIAPGTLQIPIFVSAVDLATYSDHQSFLDDQLPPDDVRHLFSVACVLVDALDEVPQEDQVNVLRFACDIADVLRCAVVVSARPVHVVRTLADESSLRLPVVQLLPFEFSQAMRLIDRLVNDTQIINILQEGIASLQAHMALSPLSVSLLLDIAEAEHEVPGTIGEIFDQYMDIALGRYDIERGIEVVFQFFIKKELLSQLAWFEFFGKNRFTINESEFDCFLEEYFETRRLAKEMIPRMKSDIDRSGVVRFSDGVYFAHRSFLDFYVALYVRNHSNDFGEMTKWLAEVYLSDKWSEVVFYFFAQRREVIEGFLEDVELLERDDVDYHLRRFLLGRILQAGWLSPSDIKVRGIEIGINSAPILFEMVSKELEADTPRLFPYGVIAGLAELSYSSRTLHQEVSDVTLQLIGNGSVDDFRNAINLLWANRTRIPTDDAVAQADLILEMMAALQRGAKLSLADRTLGLLILESIVENDKDKQRAISRRFRRMARRQPDAIKKLLSG